MLNCILRKLWSYMGHPCRSFRIEELNSLHIFGDLSKVGLVLNSSLAALSTPKRMDKQSELFKLLKTCWELVWMISKGIGMMTFLWWNSPTIIATMRVLVWHLVKHFMVERPISDRIIWNGWVCFYWSWNSVSFHGKGSTHMIEVEDGLQSIKIICRQ